MMIFIFKSLMMFPIQIAVDDTLIQIADDDVSIQIADENVSHSNRY